MFNYQLPVYQQRTFGCRFRYIYIYSSFECVPASCAINVCVTFNEFNMNTIEYQVWTVLLFEKKQICCLSCITSNFSLICG